MVGKMDVVGSTSALLTLTIFAFQSSQTLYELISSFQNHGRNARQLREEVEDLNGVLGSLRSTLDQNELDLSALELPVERCGRACQEFAEVINKCTARSQGPRTSFRDWFKISYMGKDIAGFAGLVAGYKATITIALCDANIRSTKVTADLLREYKEMIATTTGDLEVILRDIDARMRDPNLEIAGISNHALLDETDTKEERASIQQCLNICMQVSAHIDQVQSQHLANVDSPSAGDSGAIAVGTPNKARSITSETLQSCKHGLRLTSLELRARLRDAEKRVNNTLNRDGESWNDVQEHERMVEDLNSVKQCLSICAEAAEEARTERVNVFEDVNSRDEVHQIIVSTIGDLISAKRVTTGSKSTQFLGQASDATVQRYAPSSNCQNATPDGQAQNIRGTHFENVHGTGRKLS